MLQLVPSPRGCPTPSGSLHSPRQQKPPSPAHGDTVESVWSLTCCSCRAAAPGLGSHMGVSHPGMSPCASDDVDTSTAALCASPPPLDRFSILMTGRCPVCCQPDTCSSSAGLIPTLKHLSPHSMPSLQSNKLLQQLFPHKSRGCICSTTLGCSSSQARGEIVFQTFQQAQGDQSTSVCGCQGPKSAFAIC